MPGRPMSVRMTSGRLASMPASASSIVRNRPGALESGRAVDQDGEALAHIEQVLDDHDTDGQIGTFTDIVCSP